MRRFLAVTSAVIMLQSASMAFAGISFNINVGGPTIAISQPPDFLYPQELGFGVAVGVPYDMFYLDGVYFVFRGGHWYRANAYGGNWVSIRKHELPTMFRRYKISQIHDFRDREYRVYHEDSVHYRGQRFRPEGQGRGEHREMRAPGHDYRGGMSEQRHDRKEERKEDRGR